MSSSSDQGDLSLPATDLQTLGDLPGLASCARTPQAIAIVAINFHDSCGLLFQDLRSANRLLAPLSIVLELLSAASAGGAKAGVPTESGDSIFSASGKRMPLRTLSRGFPPNKDSVRNSIDQGIPPTTLNADLKGTAMPQGNPTADNLSAALPL